MKKIFILSVIITLCINSFTQTGFSYQGVLRNSDGKLRTNETLDLTASLVKDGTVVYTETHQVVTNAYGVFSMVIGSGDEYSPSIFINNDSTMVNEIYLKVMEGPTMISNTQILGVPFAEVAKVALKAHIDFPAGTIIAFGGDPDNIPSGWFLCDGTAYSKTLYPMLFAAIGTNWGTTGELFRVPDLRGVFLRGVNGSNNDDFADPDAGNRVPRYDNGSTGNKVGSFQADTMAIHNHEYEVKRTWRNPGSLNGYWVTDIGTGQVQNTKDAGGNETRPVNAYVNYIIKY